MADAQAAKVQVSGRVDETNSPDVGGSAPGQATGSGGIGGPISINPFGADQLRSGSADSGDIFVSSIGANLGEIFQPFIQGGPENGGYPVNLSPRPVSSGLGGLSFDLGTPVGSAGGSIPIAAVVAAGTIGLVLLLKRRRS